MVCIFIFHCVTVQAENIALMIFAQPVSVHFYIEYPKVEHKSNVMVFQVVLVCAVQTGHFLGTASL